MTQPSKLLTVLAALLFLIGVSACSSSTDDSAGGPSDTTVTDDGPDGPDEPDDDPPEATGDEAEYVDAMTESMLSDGEFPASEDEARCISTNTVQVIGVDRFEEAGISPADIRDSDSGDPEGIGTDMDLSDVGLSEDEANQIYDGFGDCGLDFRELMFEQMRADGDITPEIEECVDQVLTDDAVRTLMVTGMMEGDDAIETSSEMQSIMNEMTGCMINAGDLMDG